MNNYHYEYFPAILPATKISWRKKIRAVAMHWSMLLVWFHYFLPSVTAWLTWRHQLAPWLRDGCEQCKRVSSEPKVLPYVAGKVDFIDEDICRLATVLAQKWASHIGMH